MATKLPKKKGGAVSLQARNFMFTSYMLDWGSDYVFDPVTTQYIIFQQEKCPNTGRLHWQGYAEFVGKKTYKQAGNVLGDTKMHFDKRKGSQEQAIAYCSKLESRICEPVTYGIPARAGKRSDLEAVWAEIKQKRPLEELVENFPVQFIKYQRGLNYVRDVIQEERKVKTTVIILWGHPDGGKTWDAMHAFGESCYKKPNGQWWDRYDQQENVILDDYDGYINFREFLQLCDAYPHQIPFKGGFKKFNSKRIIITANIDPDVWYPNLCELSKRAFERRITARFYYERRWDDPERVPHDFTGL